MMLSSGSASATAVFPRRRSSSNASAISSGPVAISAIPTGIAPRPASATTTARSLRAGQTGPPSVPSTARSLRTGQTGPPSGTSATRSLRTGQTMSKPEITTTRLDDAARAGWLYYVAGNTQDEIAAKLGISRQSAQRMVSLAVSRGLIKVRLDHPIADCLDLSRRLKEKYALRVCEVVPADPASQST